MAARSSKIEYDTELVGSYSVEGKELVMRFTINPHKSKSEKSMLLATTSGTEIFTHDGLDIAMNINCYVPIKQWEAKAKKSSK